MSLATSIKLALLSNLDVSYNNTVFINEINLGGPNKRSGYQVLSERKGYEFGDFYNSNELDIAIDKFLLLKNIKHAT